MPKQHGAIAAGHPLTAEAAQHSLEAGGNAVDALIAALFTACVCEPVLASLGGGGFALVQTADTKAEVFDFFTQTPQQKKVAAEADFYAATVDFGSATQDFHIGTGAAATPGMLRGLFDLHARHGSLPMQELTAFATQQAKQGVRLCAYQAYILSLVEPIFLATPAARALYASETQADQVKQAGAILRNPDFADTLEVLSTEGARLFYEGEIAQAIAQQCASGGHLTQHDLQDYRCILRQPLAFNYQGWSILSNPPPSAGGSLIALALQLLHAVDGQLGEFGSARYVEQLIAVMRATQEARLAHTSAQGNPDFARLSDPSLIDYYQQAVLQHSRAYRGTTHVSIMDAQGNEAAATVSNGEGCGHIIPHTGIMLNNMLGEEDLNPLGFFRWACNERLSSMMAPTLSRHSNGDLIALGSGGSNRIRSAILQVLINLLHFELPLDVAIQAPRLHFEQDITYIEGGFSASALHSLQQTHTAYRQWQDLNMFFGGVHTVARRQGKLQGMGDPRRGGVAYVI